ncbi:MAG: hypothetical protein Fur0025_26200 [Oscillatoriaceae cyanobacterium]
MDDIATQARLGSVAAIIQVLNDKLADYGVRTRAVLADGVLQILCEAATADRLERETTIDLVRQILESISPQNIRRVRINSRIVREQQLLWLEEINRDPEGQLLWSGQIKLARPNIIKRLLEDWKIRRRQGDRGLLPPAPSFSHQRRQPDRLWHGFLGGAGVMLLLVGGGTYYHRPQQLVKTEYPTEAATLSPVAVSSDSFAQAVRVAEQAAAAGKEAKTRSDWLTIAALWDQASNLMAAVPPSHPEYKTAQNRTELYRRNSDSTQAKAAKMAR